MGTEHMLYSVHMLMIDFLVILFCVWLLMLSLSALPAFIYFVWRVDSSSKFDCVYIPHKNV